MHHTEDTQRINKWTIITPKRQSKHKVSRPVIGLAIGIGHAYQEKYINLSRGSNLVQSFLDKSLLGDQFRSTPNSTPLEYKCPNKISNIIRPAYVKKKKYEGKKKLTSTTQSLSNATPLASPVSRSTADAATNTKNQGCRNKTVAVEATGAAPLSAYIVTLADASMERVWNSFNINTQSRMSKNFSMILIISGRSKSTTVSNQVNNQENTEEFELIKAVLINIGRIDKISNLNDAQSFEGNNSRHGVHKSAHPWTSCKNHKLPGCPKHFSPITNIHHQTRFPD